MAEIPLNLRQLGITYESLRRTQEYADSHPVAELGDWSTIGATSTTHGVVTDPQGVRIIILLPNYYPRMACRAHALTPIREGEGSIRLPTRPPSQALSAAAEEAAEEAAVGSWHPPLAAPKSCSILLDPARSCSRHPHADDLRSVPSKFELFGSGRHPLLRTDALL
jgi:hypothetical protein